VSLFAGSVIAMLCLVVSSTGAQVPASPTRVIHFNPPAHLPDRMVRGECTARSIVASRRTDTFRCTIGGDTLYDPCFKTTNNQVLCDVDPRDASIGIVLGLTRPLPAAIEHTAPPSSSGVWFFELADGTTCRPLPSPGRVVEGMVELFSCHFSLASGDADAALGDLDASKSVWTIVKAQINKKIEPQTIKSAATAAVSTVWQ
jgi:hypothetical protein